jgi:hypothetical protein
VTSSCTTFERQPAVVAGDGAQLGGPVGVVGVDGELREDDLGDAVEQGRLVRRVPVQDHRVPVQGAGEAAHGQPVGPVAVDDVQRGGEHYSAGDLAAAAVGVGVIGGAGGGGRTGHRSGAFLSCRRDRRSHMGFSVGLQC